MTSFYFSILIITRCKEKEKWSNKSCDLSLYLCPIFYAAMKQMHELIVLFHVFFSLCKTHLGLILLKLVFLSGFLALLFL